MDATKFTLLVLTTLSMILAGCHEPVAEDDGHGDVVADDHTDDTHTDETPADEPAPPEEVAEDSNVSFTAGRKESLNPGDTLTLTGYVEISDGRKTESDHAGLHWSKNSTANIADSQLRPTHFEGAGPHTSVKIPGEYHVNWTIEEPGTYYYRAHVLWQGQHLWGPERMVVVEA